MYPFMISYFLKIFFHRNSVIWINFLAFIFLYKLTIHLCYVGFTTKLENESAFLSILFLRSTAKRPLFWNLTLSLQVYNYWGGLKWWKLTQSHCYFQMGIPKGLSVVVVRPKHTDSSVEPFESQTIEFHKMEEGGTLSSLRPWFTDSLTFFISFQIKSRLNSSEMSEQKKSVYIHLYT